MHFAMTALADNQMTEKQTLSKLNQLDRPAFIDLLGGIYEHSPWVAELILAKLPFDSVDALHQTMIDTVKASDLDTRLALIRNHPELAGKEAADGTLTTDSKKEQSRAGLNQCSAEELERIRGLNKSYLQKFGFPFVIAVSGLNKHQIIDAMQTRLDSDEATEFVTSLNEIDKIAKIRLDALIDG